MQKFRSRRNTKIMLIRLENLCKLDFADGIVLIKIELLQVQKELLIPHD